MQYRAMGIRGSASFEEIMDHLSARGLRAVLMDPAYIAGPDHMLSAAMHAERAFAQGTARSKTFETEVILYCAWERQIGRANDRMRPKEGSEEHALLLIGDGDPRLEEIGIEEDGSILAVDDAKRQRLALLDPFLSPEDQALENVASVDMLKNRFLVDYNLNC
jgi:KEOPS complex subunit Cgi121